MSYVTRDIHHILQGLKKLSTYVVQVSAVLDDGGETDVSEVEFETGKLTIPDTFMRIWTMTVKDILQYSIKRDIFVYNEDHVMSMIDIMSVLTVIL